MKEPNVPTNAQTFAEMWRFYEDRVMAEGAGEIQRTECKRAFYLGGMLLRIVLENAPDGALAEAAYCDRLEAEFDQFMAEDIAENCAVEGNA